MVPAASFLALHERSVPRPGTYAETACGASPRARTFLAGSGVEVARAALLWQVVPPGYRGFPVPSAAARHRRDPQETIALDYAFDNVRICPRGAGSGLAST